MRSGNWLLSMTALLQVKNLRVSFPAGGMWKPGGKSVDGVVDVLFAVGPGETYAVGGAVGDVVCRLEKVMPSAAVPIDMMRRRHGSFWR